jgi:hypothetical protein
MQPLRETPLSLFKPVPLHPRVRFCAVIMAGLASSSIVAIYLAQQHHALAVLSSLMIGFAPLLGLFILLVILALLYFLLLSSVERIFTCGNDNSVPERETKNKWHVIRSVISSPHITDFLSLKEHSPPALQ